MKHTKKAAVLLAALLTVSFGADVSAQVMPNGRYTKGNQWYFSDDKQFDYTGILNYDSDGNLTESSEGYSFSAKSPEAIYKDGVTDYSVEISHDGISAMIQCKIGIKGDVNGNKKHDIFDAVAIAKFTVGSYKINDDFTAFLADIDRDGKINIFDSVSAARLAVENMDMSNAVKDETPKDENEEILKRVLALVNAERKKRGIAPMKMNSKINKAAGIRAQELVKWFAHERPDGRSCFTALDECNVSYYTAGENIAAGYATPETVVEGWMNSEGHRANILNPDFGTLGVGYYKSDNSQYRYYWTQMFTN